MGGLGIAGVIEWKFARKKLAKAWRSIWKFLDGASEGIRTLDTHVGNVMLYQAELRSLPIQP